MTADCTCVQHPGPQGGRDLYPSLYSRFPAPLEYILKIRFTFRNWARVIVNLALQVCSWFSKKPEKGAICSIVRSQHPLSKVSCQVRFTFNLRSPYCAFSPSQQPMIVDKDSMRHSSFSSPKSLFTASTTTLISEWFIYWCCPTEKGNGKQPV